MYDWPEERAATDAFWTRLRDALRAEGFDAPDTLTRGGDPWSLWRHPDLMLAQTQLALLVGNSNEETHLDRPRTDPRYRTAARPRPLSELHRSPASPTTRSGVRQSFSAARVDRERAHEASRAWARLAFWVQKQGLCCFPARFKPQPASHNGSATRKKISQTDGPNIRRTSDAVPCAVVNATCPRSPTGWRDASPAHRPNPPRAAHYITCRRYRRSVRSRTAVPAALAPKASLGSRLTTTFYFGPRLPVFHGRKTGSTASHVHGEAKTPYAITGRIRALLTGDPAAERPRAARDTQPSTSHRDTRGFKQVLRRALEVMKGDDLLPAPRGAFYVSAGSELSLGSAKSTLLRCANLLEAHSASGARESVFEGNRSSLARRNGQPAPRRPRPRSPAYRTQSLFEMFQQFNLWAHNDESPKNCNEASGQRD